MKATVNDGLADKEVDKPLFGYCQTPLGESGHCTGMRDETGK